MPLVVIRKHNIAFGSDILLKSVDDMRPRYRLHLPAAQGVFRVTRAQRGRRGPVHADADLADS